jgi:hypothetical protein
MQQDASDAVSNVSPKQERAIELLLAGETPTQIARQLEVDRSTLYRWQDQPDFLALLNRNRRALGESFQARIESLLGLAIAAIEEALHQGDGKTAINVLRGSGLLDGRKAEIGPTTVEAVKQSQAEQKNRDALSEMINSLGAC